ncbi:MAG: hypothetical protein AB1643_02320 [Patescibacteria group bacterium]
MYEEYLKDLLRKNLESSQASLNILKKMERARKMAMIFKIVKWIVIIAITLGLYYYIEPYLSGLKTNLNNMMNVLEQLKKTSDAMNSANLSPNTLEKIKNLIPAR